jgi:hypothetical protein
VSHKRPFSRRLTAGRLQPETVRIMGTERLTVDITFCHKSTEEGGRRTPIFSRYRPNWHIGRFQKEPGYEGQPWYFDGQLELVGSDQVAPGECGTGRIEVMSPEYWRHLRVGDQIEMGEGPRVVALAKITAITWSDDGA